MVKRKKQRGRSRVKKREAGGGRQAGFWRSLLRLLPSLLVALLLVFLFSRLGALHKLQTAVSDTVMRLADPPAESEVAIVEITDKDYETLFRRESPLDHVQLQLLVGAIARSNPRIIGVDIDTSPDKYQNFVIDGEWPPIIWERDVERIPENEEERLEPAAAVLGREDPQFIANSGVPVFFDDPEDGMTRRYSRLINPTGNNPLPSFPWAVITKIRADEARGLAPSTEKFFIRYTGSIEKNRRVRESQGTWMTASELLERSETKGWAESTENHLKGKVVLLGGTYGDDDLHYTPVGRMYGVQIIAQVLETELQGGGDKAPSHATIILLELFECVAVILLFHSFHTLGFLRALALSLLSVVVISAVCSVLSFGSIYRVAVFIPVLICVLIYEFSVEYRAEVVKKLSVLFGAKPDHGH